MPFVPFYEHVAEMADQETRYISVLDDSDLGLPPGEYAFMDMYCDERGRDCRRVFFYVVRRGRRNPEAVIAWGWEDVDFYWKWLKHGGHADAVTLKGPILNPGSPGTKLGPALLRVVRNVLLADPEYVERIKRHYRMVRDKVDQPRLLRRSRKLIKPKNRPKKRN